MKTRLIAFFPQFLNIDSLQALRLRFDPLAPRIAPHIALVGPFSSSLPRWVLRDHLVKVLEDVPQFKLELQGLQYSGNELLSLSVKKGAKQIQSIYKAVCAGVLTEFVTEPATAFVPQLVIGRFANAALRDEHCSKLGRDTEKYKDVLKQLHMVIIAEDGSTEDEFIYQF